MINEKKTQRRSNRRLNLQSHNSIFSYPGHGTKIPKIGIKSLKSTSSLKDFYYLRLIVHSNVNTVKYFSKKKKLCRHQLWRQVPYTKVQVSRFIHNLFILHKTIF